MLILKVVYCWSSHWNELPLTTILHPVSKHVNLELTSYYSANNTWKYLIIYVQLRTNRQSAFQFAITLFSVSSNTYRISGHLHCYLNSWGLACSLLWPIKVHVKGSLAFDLGQYVYAEVIMQMFPTHLMQGIFKDQVTLKNILFLNLIRHQFTVPFLIINFKQ